MKKALVTGAGGFIGHHLVRRLVEAHVEVSALVRYTSSTTHGLLEHLPAAYKSGYQVHFGDIRDYETVRRAMLGCDVVFHLAALVGIPYSYVSPNDVAAVNIGGTLNVLQAAREVAGIERVIVTSTSEVYGTAQWTPITEDHPLNAQSPYAATKVGADQLALSFHRTFELPVSVCRPFNTFGPGQSQRAVIPTIIVQALYGDRVELGSLTPTRDLNFVDNTVDGFLALAASSAPVGRVFQFASNSEITVGALAKRILEITGKSNLPILSADARRRPAASEVERLIGSYESAEKELAWRPRVTLDAGLVTTVDWIRQHAHLYPLRGYRV